MPKQPRNGAEPGQLAVRRSVATGTAALLLTSLVVGTPPTATAKDTNQAAAAAVISEWNEIAQKTLLADTTKATPRRLPLHGICACGGLQRRGRHRGSLPAVSLPHTRHRKEPPPQAAAVAAAHKVLLAYSPDGAARRPGYLRTPASLAKIPDGRRRDSQASRSASWPPTRLIKQRAARRTQCVQSSSRQQPAPGVWRPTPAPTTPPNLSPFAVPWLGSVTPLLVKSSDQFGEPGTPPKLTSGAVHKGIQ